MSGIPSWFLNIANANGSSAADNGALADASVAITTNNVSPKYGDTVTFTVTAGDNGPGGADGLGISAPLGAAFEYVSSVAQQGSFDSQTGLWSVGSIANGSTAKLTITAEVVASGWNLETAQVVSESTFDANFTNNVAYAAVAVLPQSVGPMTVNQVQTDGSAPVAAAIQGAYNQQIVTPAANATVLLAQGYQSAVLTGSAAATLVDVGVGNALLVAGSGNATLLSAAGGDTLQGGSGNNVMVGFEDGTTMTAAGTSGSNLFWGNGSVTVTGGNGQDTMVGLGGGMVNTGTGGSQVWAESGAFLVTSNGADTIIASAGASTINVQGSSGALVFGGNGSIVFNGGEGASTLVGFNSSVTVNGADGGGVFFGGSAGNNLLNSGSGQADMFGAGSGDTLVATGSANDVMVAGSGAETLTAAGSSGNDAFFGGVGSDLMVGGSGVNAFTAGWGDMTLVGGGGGDLYEFLDGAVSDTIIKNFNPSNDFVGLSGYAAGADAAAFGSLTNTSSGAVAQLSDGTFITFSGIDAAALKVGNFI